jgi:hypothetical protein
MLREEAGRFLKIAKRIVRDDPEPWIWKPREDPGNPGAGRPPRYVARSMAVLCLSKVYSRNSFRWIDGFLRNNESIRRELGFVNRCPSYEAIRRAMLHLDESYLRNLNRRVIAELEETSAQSHHRFHWRRTKIFDRWLSNPTDRSKDIAKLHAAVDDRGAAHSIAITDGTTSDTILLPYLLNDIDAHMGVVRADRGYLSKDNVQCIEDLGLMNGTAPKSYSKMLSCGRPAWRHMMFMFRKDPEPFLKEHNQQRRIEAFFSKFKRRFGPVKSRIGAMLRKEVWVKILILNILVAASEQVEMGLRVAR